MEVKKVPQEILDQIQTIRPKKEYIIREFGEIAIATEELSERNQAIVKYRKDTLQEEATLTEYLASEYGNGTLNTDTGEFTPIEG